MIEWTPCKTHVLIIAHHHERFGHYRFKGSEIGTLLRYRTVYLIDLCIELASGFLFEFAQRSLLGGFSFFDPTSRKTPFARMIFRSVRIAQKEKG